MILFDTCAILDISAGMHLKNDVEEQLAVSITEGCAFASIFSAWEIGRLAASNRIAMPLAPLDLFRNFMEIMGLSEAPLTPSILIASSFLPGEFHRDPMDRILVATARETGARILTRDRAILAYGARGHVRTIAC